MKRTLLTLVALLSLVGTSGAAVIVDENFDSYADIDALNAVSGWSVFGSPGGNLKIENMPGETWTYDSITYPSDPNTLYTLRNINSTAGEQYQWSSVEPTELAPVRYTFWIMTETNKVNIDKGSVLASGSSGLGSAVVSWYDPDQLNYGYGVRCYNTFTTGGSYSPEEIAIAWQPQIVHWKKMDLLCKGTTQEVYVDDVLVGTWGPAASPTYDLFELWQWGRCESYEAAHTNTHPTEIPAAVWYDSASIKTGVDSDVADWASY